MSAIKTANTQYPVIDLIRQRWSPRSFADKSISRDDMHTILEAASWSFSALNEQPWRYTVAYRGTPLFDKFASWLAAGNQPWARHAAILALSSAVTSFSNGRPYTDALHDTGAANMLLTLQAGSMGIGVHPMAGFDKEAALAFLPEGLQPVIMLAMGYPDTHEKLDEPYRTRELAPRTRKPLQEFLINAE
jgi:nitroreductase